MDHIVVSYRMFLWMGHIVVEVELLFLVKSRRQLVVVEVVEVESRHQWYRLQ
jgi:hypothetical protein